MSGSGTCRQVLISSPTGLFSGGTQRTALVIAVADEFEPVVRAAPAKRASGEAEAESACW